MKPKEVKKKVRDFKLYEIDRVLASRFNRVTKKPQSLIKWKGYPVCDATWEDDANFEWIYVDELISGYCPLRVRVIS